MEENDIDDATSEHRVLDQQSTSNSSFRRRSAQDLASISDDLDSDSKLTTPGMGRGEVTVPKQVLRKRGHRNSVMNPDLSLFHSDYRVRGWLEKKKQKGLFKRGYQKRW